MMIQPQAVNPRDARQGYVARFDNLQEAMGYLKAVDTLETAMSLDPLVQVATLGPLHSPEGAVLGHTTAQVLHHEGFDVAVNGTNRNGTDWTIEGPAGIVSFTENKNGMAAVVVDGSGFRSVAVSPRGGGILYQEF
jgi:hypothetical protein